MGINIGTRKSDQISGTEGVDLIVSLGGDDEIDAGGGNDIVLAGSGDDTVFGGDGSDLIVGGSGDDNLDGGNGNDRILGGRGNDTVVGGGGNDALSGGNGDDTLDGGLGNDIVSGGRGNDVAIYDATVGTSDCDVYDGGSGTDTLRLRLTTAQLTLFAAELTAYETHIATTPNVTFQFTFGLSARSFERLEIEVVDSPAELDAVNDTAAIDLATAQAMSIDVLANDVDPLGNGLTIVDASILSGEGAISIAAGQIVYDGAGAYASLASNDSRTVLIAYTVADSDGKSDQALVELNVVGAAAALVLEEVTGTDPVVVTGTGDNLITGDAANNDVTISGGNNSVDLGDGDDTVTMTGAGSDRVVGGLGDDTISTGEGSDTIIYVVGDGNDIVDGGDDADLLEIAGSDGDDLLEITANGTVITVAAGAGSLQVTGIEDIVISTGGGGDSVVVSGDFSATALDPSTITIIGDGGDNLLDGSGLVSAHGLELRGLGGNDTLIGGAGNDLLDGGTGYDIVRYDRIGIADLVIDLSGPTATADATQSGTAFTDTLIDIEEIQGSNRDDNYVGSAANDVFHANDGTDIVDAGAGDDYVDLGSNADFDLYFGSTGNDTIIWDPGSSAIAFYDFDYSALAGIDATFTSAGGSIDKGADGIDTLVADSIVGVDGGFTIIGTAGADTYLMDLGTGVWIQVSPGGGNDTITGTGTLVRLSYLFGPNGPISGIDVDVTGYGPFGRMSGTVNNDGYGGVDTFVDIFEIRGTVNNDTFTGSSDDDRFNPFGGSDTVNAGGGYDTVRYDKTGVSALTIDMSGTTGVVTGDLGGQAFTDTLIDVERIMGSSAGNDYTGSAGDDTFHGQGGVDIVNAGAGNDYVDLGSNADFDLYFGSTGNDTIIWDPGSSAIAFYDFDYSALAGIDATFTSVGGSIDKGADGIDTLVADSIVGVDGGFTIIGTAGADNYLMDVGADVWTQVSPGGGNDTITGTDTFVRLSYIFGPGTSVGGIDVEVSGYGPFGRMSGTVHDDGFGGVDTFVDIGEIRGTGFADSFTGSTGSDRFNPYGGNDVVNGGAGLDMVRYDQSGISALTIDLSGPNGVVTGTGFGQAFTDTLISVERVHGSREGDTIIGSANDDQIDGKQGDDTINAGRGERSDQRREWRRPIRLRPVQWQRPDH